MDNDVPCKNCITLAMCIKQMEPKYSGTALMGYIENTLMNKCSILLNYVYETEYKSSYAQYRRVMDFYKHMLYGE